MRAGVKPASGETDDEIVTAVLALPATRVAFAHVETSANIAVEMRIICSSNSGTWAIIIKRGIDEAERLSAIIYGKGLQKVLRKRETLE